MPLFAGDRLRCCERSARVDDALLARLESGTLDELDLGACQSGTQAKSIVGPFGSGSGRGSVSTVTLLARRSPIVFVNGPVERQPMWSRACPSLGSASPRCTSTRRHGPHL
jgi:hypothetical protein